MEESGNAEAKRACADASERPNLLWSRTTSSVRTITYRTACVQPVVSPGEFTQFNSTTNFRFFIGLRTWGGTPEGTGRQKKDLSAQFLERGIWVQKSMRALNVIVRFPVAVVMRPKVVELMFVFGVPQIRLFKTLTASARSEKVRRQVLLERVLKTGTARERV